MNFLFGLLDSLCQVVFVVEFEVDGTGARPVPPRLLQDGGESRLQRLETQDDEGPVVDVVARAEGIIGLDPLHLLVQAWNKKEKMHKVTNSSSD